MKWSLYPCASLGDRCAFGIHLPLCLRIVVWGFLYSNQSTNEIGCGSAFFSFLFSRHLFGEGLVTTRYSWNLCLGEVHFRSMLPAGLDISVVVPADYLSLPILLRDEEDSSICFLVLWEAGGPISLYLHAWCTFMKRMHGLEVNEN